jgi:hypothetical protein
LYVAPALEGVHAQRNDSVNAGRGGLAIAVAQQLSSFVTYESISPCGRAMSVHLDGLPFGSLGLLNVYGPNVSSKRAALWESLAHLVDLGQPWLIGGDYNMTVLASDQCGGSPSNLGGAEAASWLQFLSALGFTEIPRVSTSRWSTPGITRTLIPQPPPHRGC